MFSYAAIEINQANIIELFAHVIGVPDGKSRLAWALFSYPYDAEERYFFIGGNYLGLNQPNYMRQIISQSQLDKQFSYNQEVLEPRKNRPRNDGCWFLITPLDGS